MRSWSFILKPLANGDFSLSFPFDLSLLDYLALEFFWTFFYFSINPDCAIGSVPYLLVVVIMVVIAGKKDLSSSVFPGDRAQLLTPNCLRIPSAETLTAFTASWRREMALIHLLVSAILFLRQLVYLTINDLCTISRSTDEIINDVYHKV